MHSSSQIFFSFYQQIKRIPLIKNRVVLLRKKNRLQVTRIDSNEKLDKKLFFLAQLATRYKKTPILKKNLQRCYQILVCYAPSRSPISQHANIKNTLPSKPLQVQTISRRRRKSHSLSKITKLKSRSLSNLPHNVLTKRAMKEKMVIGLFR